MKKILKILLYKMIFKHLNHNFVFELEYQVPTKLRVIDIARFIQNFIFNKKSECLAGE